MKNKTKAIVSTVLAFISNILYTPSEAYAVAVATRMTSKEPIAAKPVAWTKKFSKSYAKAVMSWHYPEWSKTEFYALSKLWGKESAWNPKAKNPHSSAFGIPQLLKLDPSTPAPLQIERGLAYIKHRYDKPSIAWSHWRKHGWY